VEQATTQLRERSGRRAFVDSVTGTYPFYAAATDVHATTCTLPTEPEGVVASLLERFNSGKISTLMTLYDSEAVLVAQDGRTVTDRIEIAAELERDMRLGLPLEAKARHVFVTGDIAEIVVDWSIDGTGPDGEHVHLGGSASDVARRGRILADPDRQ
jgi:ketosteroid isomerase-like protein